MSATSIYLLDADVLITAKNSYYAFDICPGFWKGLLHQHQQGRVFSVSRVRTEILRGSQTEDLVQWVKSQVPNEFFFEVDEGEVPAAFAEVMSWAQRNTQFTDSAKAEFADAADGWLVASAMIHGGVVVTNETSHPDSKKRIKLPDVCNQFNVVHKGTFRMLRELVLQFDVARFT